MNRPNPEPRGGVAAEAAAPDDRLAGRVVLITGAGSGIGRGIAAAVGTRGATVVVTARRPDELADLVTAIETAGGTAVATRCDVTDPADVASAIAMCVNRFGGVDAVVHNAVSRHSSDSYDIGELDEARWTDLSAVSVVASATVATAAFDSLRERSGSIVYMTSINALEGARDRPGYAAIKAAQRGLAKSLAREWGQHGIRVNCVAPLAETDSSRHGFEQAPGLREHILSYLPLGRFGEPASDVGAVVAFLVSDDARYVTGQTLFVDGGLYMGS